MLAGVSKYVVFLFELCIVFNVFHPIGDNNARTFQCQSQCEGSCTSELLNYYYYHDYYTTTTATATIATATTLGLV